MLGVLVCVSIRESMKIVVYESYDGFYEVAEIEGTQTQTSKLSFTNALNFHPTLFRSKTNTKIDLNWSRNG